MLLITTTSSSTVTDSPGKVPQLVHKLPVRGMKREGGKLDERGNVSAENVPRMVTPSFALWSPEA